MRAGKVLVACALFGNARVTMQNDTTKTVTAVNGERDAVFESDFVKDGMFARSDGVAFRG